MNVLFFNYACYADILFPGIYIAAGEIKPHLLVIENIFYAGISLVIGWYLNKKIEKYYNCMAIAGLALLGYILLERHWQVSASYLILGNNLIKTLLLPLVLILPFISNNIFKFSKKELFTKFGLISFILFCFLFSLAALLIANSFASYLVFLAVVLSQLFIKQINKTARPAIVLTIVASIVFATGYVSIKYPGRISRLYEEYFNDSNSGMVYQSRISIETINFGGLTGKSIGSTDLAEVPDVSSDYTLVLVGKQFGYIGLTYFLLLYFIFFYALYLSIKSLPHSQYKLLAGAGLIFMFAPFLLQTIRILNLFPFIPSYKIPFLSMRWDYSHFIALAFILKTIYMNRRKQTKESVQMQ
jgi:cell division protein FtsW (lipid II flippase)